MLLGACMLADPGGATHAAVHIHDNEKLNERAVRGGQTALCVHERSHTDRLVSFRTAIFSGPLRGNTTCVMMT